VTILGITMGFWQGIGFVILGIVVILGALVGGVLLLAKLIFDQTEGLRKKQAQWDARVKTMEQRLEEDGEHNQRLPLYKPTDFKSRFVSSVDLNIGDIVYLRKEQWRVTEKLNTQLGMLIRLQNVLRPRITSPNRIKQENVYDKVWCIRPEDWNR
jgi:hypothetical protein